MDPHSIHSFAQGMNNGASAQQRNDGLPMKKIIQLAVIIVVFILSGFAMVKLYQSLFSGPSANGVDYIKAEKMRLDDERERRREERQDKLYEKIDGNIERKHDAEFREKAAAIQGQHGLVKAMHAAHANSHSYLKLEKYNRKKGVGEKAYLESVAESINTQLNTKLVVGPVQNECRFSLARIPITQLKPNDKLENGDY